MPLIGCFETSRDGRISHSVGSWFVFAVISDKPYRSFREVYQLLLLMRVFGVPTFGINLRVLRLTTNMRLSNPNLTDEGRRKMEEFVAKVWLENGRVRVIS